MTCRELDPADPARVLSAREQTFAADPGHFSWMGMAFQVRRCSGQVLECTLTAD